jgi:general transcription factor 3C protein 4
VLAGHTHHIITNIMTSPALADPSAQLNLSVAARQVFLDHIQGDMFEDRQTAKQEPYLRSLTAWTTGWSGLGEAGVLSWTGE